MSSGIKQALMLKRLRNAAKNAQGQQQPKTAKKKSCIASFFVVLGYMF